MMFDSATLLQQIRDRVSPGQEVMQAAALAIGDAQMSDAQVGAFAMAIYFNGLDPADKVALTMGMRDSGDVLQWDLPGPATDKHSTGGVGDCVSLVLAPVLAACGAYVPMVSGRGLGHTGGTLDKLEAIPGYQTAQSEADFKALVRANGAAIVAATGQIAPADKRLYAIRDVTGTVESIDLITASILSKKLAAGLETLVLDVKVGSGAFMKDLPAAQALARSLVETANGAGCATHALITDMNAPCVPSIGNGVEVAQVMRCLAGESPGILRELVVELAAEGLVLAGLATDLAEGQAQAIASLSAGTATEAFARMVAAQGGPADFVENWQEYLPKAPVSVPVPAPHAGFVETLDGRALGRAVVHLGGGRLREDDVLDLSVGLDEVVSIGAQVEKGEPLAIVHARNAEEGARAVKAVQSAVTLGDACPAKPTLIVERVTL